MANNNDGIQYTPNEFHCIGKYEIGSDIELIP